MRDSRPKPKPNETTESRRKRVCQDLAQRAAAAASPTVGIGVEVLIPLVLDAILKIIAACRDRKNPEALAEKVRRARGRRGEALRARLDRVIQNEHPGLTGLQVRAIRDHLIQEADREPPETYVAAQAD